MNEQIIEIDEDGKVHGNTLADALASALNRFSAENGSNTPDFLLAEYLLDCLAAWNRTSRAREAWYGKALRIGGAATQEALREQFNQGIHGVHCRKVTHVGGGYLHGDDDDRPYDVDSVSYCGRCHMALRTL